MKQEMGKYNAKHNTIGILFPPQNLKLSASATGA
jgi:hypothetical protein